MTQYWHGKRAVITGGSSGMGLALADALTARGANVALTARGQEALDGVKQRLAARGDVLTVVADVTKDGDVARLANVVRDEWGGVDFLCHSAGRSMRGHACSTPVDKYQELWDLNFLGSVRCIQAFADLLVGSHGHFVLMGSLASKVAPKYFGAYPASKFAVAALAQQLRLELGPKGVHVLLVCPGPIAREVERRYQAPADVPTEALTVAAGAKLNVIQPDWLATQILRACERRKAELIVPARARALFVLSQLSPRLGDRLLRRKMPE